jgi:hypothetical protein
MFCLKQQIEKVKKSLNLNINGKKFGKILTNFKVNQKTFDFDISDFVCRLMVLERNLQIECSELKSFLKGFNLFLSGNFQERDYQYEKYSQKNKITEIRKKFIDLADLKTKIFEIKHYLNVPDMDNFYNHDDKVVIQKYESLKLSIKHNEIELDRLINENVSIENEIKHLNSKEKSFSRASNIDDFEELDQIEIKQNIKNSIKELEATNIELKNQKEGKLRVEKNQASLSVKSYLFTDSALEFFKTNLSKLGNITVLKIEKSKSSVFGKTKLMLKDSIKNNTRHLNFNNIFVIILNPCENIEFDFEWLDDRFQDSPRKINVVILSEITSLNNIKMYRNLKNIKSKLISIRDKEKALNEMIKEY